MQSYRNLPYFDRSVFALKILSVRMVSFSPRFCGDSLLAHLFAKKYLSSRIFELFGVVRVKVDDWR